MKKLKLTAWQRLMLIEAMESSHGSVGFLRRALSAINTLKLSGKEKEEIGYKRQGNVITWQDEQRQFELEFESDVFNTIKKLVEGKKDWPSKNAEQIINLARQLDIN